MVANTPSTRFQLLFLALKVKHPKLANVSALLPLAIAQHEAKPDFSSNLAVTAHNIFGMKYPSGRVAAGMSTAIGKTASGFAIFKSLYAGIDDFMDWLEVMGLTTDAALDDFIHAGHYCPDKGYYAAFIANVNALRPTMLNPATLALDGVLGGTALVVALSAIKKVLK